MKFWHWAIIAYLVIGFVTASLMHAAIPAINAIGFTYYAATWPVWIIESVFDLDFMPIPHWMFSFS